MQHRVLRVSLSMTSCLLDVLWQEGSLHRADHRWVAPLRCSGIRPHSQHRDSKNEGADPQPTEMTGARPWSNESSGRIRNDNSTPRIINTASHTKGNSQFW